MTAPTPTVDTDTTRSEAPEGNSRGSTRIAVIGDELLAIACLEIAREAGLDVVVVLSRHQLVLESATELAIPTVDLNATDDLIAGLGKHRFDVLVSAANQRVLPAAVLSQARTSINFHDGPLPGYAGLNVTTWAIHNGETEHGVTWHLMTDEIDGGNIVASSRFEIRPDETAFSLNARCYEAATSTFPAIASALAAGTFTSEPQLEGETKMYRRRDRPQVFLDPAAPAQETARRARALDVGQRVDNTVGCARIVVAGAQYIAHDVRVGSPDPARTSGELTVDGSGGLRLCCDDGELIIPRLTDTDGHEVSARSLLEVVQQHHDGVLPSPSASLVEALTVEDPTLAMKEAWWQRRLAGLDISAPQLLIDSRTGDWSEIDIPTDAGAPGPILTSAALVWLAAVSGSDEVATAITDADSRSRLARLDPLARPAVLRTTISPATTAGQLIAALAVSLADALAHGPFLADLVDRTPQLRGQSTRPVITVDLDVGPDEELAEDGLLRLVQGGDGRLVLRHRVDAATALRIVEQLRSVLDALGDSSCVISSVPLIGPTDQRMLDDLNQTVVEHDRSMTIDGLFGEAVTRWPQQPAVSSGGRTLTYQELDHAAGNFAERLREAGIGPGDVVAISLNRGIEMVMTVLAVLRNGATYLPLDPTYPADRLKFMVDDSEVGVVVATPSTAQWLDDGQDVMVIRPDVDTAARPPVPGSSPAHGPDDLAYVIYTSGSTGLPKGVQLEHRNVANFFVAMDAMIDHDPPGVWLAVTSLSFDISVLELLWTLTRGFHVVVKSESGFGLPSSTTDSAPARLSRPTTMSLFYFAAGEEQAHEGYRLMLESARWADEQGFEAVWVPERHFHDFGAPYPNPSVVAGALAIATKQIAIRAGSVVLPLHSPIRVAEEWSVVDNLSGGRVGISFAAGWQPNDFVLNPSAFKTAKDSLPDLMRTVQALWRGESVELPGHDGAPVTVRTLPRPVQPALPTWLTSAGSTSTFERAGRLGLNVLTHLLGQSVEQLTANIKVYRTAWKETGHPGEGRITLMLHTFLNSDADLARETARQPLKGYLGTAVGLLKDMASAFPTFANAGADADAAFRSLSEDEISQLLDMAADRYLSTSGLFGDVDQALDMIRRVSAAGADEIACLIDFGIDTDAVLGSLSLLEQVHQQVRDEQNDKAVAVSPPSEETVAQLVERYGVTHLQCTPSLAAMLVANPVDRESLRVIDHLMLGGEALPTALAAELCALLGGRLTNMYGPTETTIWSLTHEVTSPPTGSIPIGTPVANNTVFVLDPLGRRLPVGVFGELHIGGEGVARGYHDREELTGERFVHRPGLGRVYATGDVVRVHPAGYVEFGGRADNQVKIRGHRVEMGEIEAVIDRHPAVSQSVVVARGDGEPILVAFVTVHADQRTSPTELRDYVADSLPGAMVPSVIAVLDALPLTPNGKIDRKRLPADIHGLVAPAAVSPEATPTDDDERLVSEVWTQELGRAVGRDENFFDIGGHSLLAIKVFRSLADSTGLPLALTDVFRYPTIRSFAGYLGSLRTGTDGSGNHPLAASAAAAGADRAARRRRRAREN